MVFQIAVGTTELTPKVQNGFPSLWMGGYGWDPRGSAPGQVARELKAHCMVIWDDGYPNVMLRADLISIPRDMNQYIRGTLVDEGLISDSDFMMVSSHTHSGPLVGDIRPNPYILMNLTPADIDAVNGTTNKLIDLLLDLVRSTLNKTRTTVTFRYAEASVAIGYNRRGGSTVLKTVPILVARKANNNRVAILFGAAAHPVTRGNDTWFDCDFPGRAATQIQNSLGVPAMFFQGTCGDQNGGNANDIPPQGDGLVVNIGDKLANAVINKINANTGFTNVTGPIMTRMEEVNLPFSVDTTNPTVIANLRSRYVARMNASNSSNPNYRHAKLMVEMIDGPGLPTHIAMPIQRWQFNGLTILAMAHEVLSSYHVKLKAAYPGKLWIMAYANEVEGYIGADAELWDGGYESGFEWPDNTIAGEGSYCVSYMWPVPLKASPVGVTPAVAGSTEKLVMDACLDLLNNP
jgi:hypothetical protein